MKTLFLSFPILFLLAACQPDLPPITRVGANTVGALIDGDVWLPQINSLAPNISSSYDSTDQTLLITATQLGDGTYFRWELSPLPAPGDYLLADWAGAGIVLEFGEIDPDAPSGRRAYATQAGSLSISTLSIDNGVFAGTFDMTVISPTGESVEIVDGRFDVRF